MIFIPFRLSCGAESDVQVTMNKRNVEIPLPSSVVFFLQFRGIVSEPLHLSVTLSSLWICGHPVWSFVMS